MKTFIIAAMTADGCIAKETSHAAFWTSKDDKKRFVELTKRAGVVIMGLNTFRTLPKPLKDRVNIVYSPEPASIEGVEITNEEPTKLIKDLEDRGFKEVAICGGSMIYSMFMKSGVVDTLYLTVEPILFGDGVRLFKVPFEYKLKLASSTTTENGTLLLEYNVIRE